MPIFSSVVHGVGGTGLSSQEKLKVARDYMH